MFDKFKTCFIFVHNYIKAVQMYEININKKYQKKGITERFSFKKGFRQLPICKAKLVQKAIMEALGITARMTWYDRLNGKIEPRVSEAEAIERIFHSQNINDIWGK